MTQLFPYWDLREGKETTFRFMTFKGSYNPDNMAICVNQDDLREADNLWTTAGGAVFRMKNFVDPRAVIQYTMRVDLDVGEELPPGTDINGRCLYNGRWDAGYFPSYIGEIGSPGFLADNPPPIMTINPVKGERFAVPVVGKLNGTEIVKLNCLYSTYDVDCDWPGFGGDMLRTCLAERFDTPAGAPNKWVYNYASKKGDGPKDIYWGLLKADNTIDEGYRMLAI